jgi:hypothetical protein
VHLRASAVEILTIVPTHQDLRPGDRFRPSGFSVR